MNTYISTRALTKQLGVSYATIHRMVRTGRLPAPMNTSGTSAKGGKLLWPVEEVNEAIARLRGVTQEKDAA